MLLLPNGNYMLMTYKPRANPTDLTSSTAVPPTGSSRTPSCRRSRPTERSSGPGTARTTSASTRPTICRRLADPADHDNVFDVVHMNAAVVDGDSIVISLRHTDGIYKIDRDTGEMVWKLGGTPTPESLTVLNDPHAANPLGGQHDAMIRGDGTLTAHDNGQYQGGPPRTVHYEIDEDAGTASDQLDQRSRRSRGSLLRLGQAFEFGQLARGLGRCRPPGPTRSPSTPRTAPARLRSRSRVRGATVPRPSGPAS